MLLIKNGRLINPATNTDGIYNIIVNDNGVIENIIEEIVANNIDETAFDRVIDATDKLVMPGFIDLHVHLREPGFEYKETIETGSKAAARGGFTSICPMPNTKPATDSPEMIREILKRAKENSPINVLPVGAITIGQEGTQMTDIVGMVEAGAVAISEDGKSVMNSSLYKEAMIEAKKAGIVVLAHCEDKGLVGSGAMNEGAKSRELGIAGISNAVEDIITARDIILAKETGARLHLCHCSTEDSVRMVREAKADGVQVSAEVCPHHFTLTEDDIVCDDANYKMNPPLRTRKDVDTLIEGLCDGTMEAISTDHAPHSAEEKKNSIANAPFGIVGSETAFSLSYTELVKNGRMSINQLVEKMSTNPAKIIGIDKGDISVGKIADITIAEVDTEYKIDVNTFVSKGKNTPFDGRKVFGQVEYTIVSGKVVYEA